MSAPDDLATLRARLAVLRAQACAGEPALDLRRDLERLVLVGSSSRGGSSVFAEVLRHTVDALHLRGEMNPFVRLHGLAPRGLEPRGEALGPDDVAPDELLLDLASECGQPAHTLPDRAARRAYAADLAYRLSLQWPGELFELEELESAVGRTLAGLEDRPGWGGGGFPDVQLFFVRLLHTLRPAHPRLDPYLYDLDPTLIAREMPEAEPGEVCLDTVVEEPPFVPIGPWRRATRSELACKPLIIKTPGNAYRAPWLQAILPRTRLHLLHLTRNVAASVNGLYDGWRYRGFHSHRVPGALHIEAYTGEMPGGRDWWKFDLPPGWTGWTRAPLRQVCAFQWRSAHHALLDTACALPPSCTLRLPFETFLAEVEPTIRRLSGWLGVSLTPGAEQILQRGSPTVMATCRPRQRRWFARAAMLGDVVHDPLNLELMGRLGYGQDPRGWA
jgi:hypothetical protein